MMHLFNSRGTLIAEVASILCPGLPGKVQPHSTDDFTRHIIGDVNRWGGSYCRGCQALHDKEAKA